MKNIKEFLNAVKAQMVTEEGIRSFLLSLNNKEFIVLISSALDNNPHGKPDIDISKMTEEHAPIISEIIADLTLNEKLQSLSNISNDFYLVEQMIFKTLPIDKASKMFYENPSKYKEEIESYIETPRQTKEKDILIATILSKKELYCNFPKEILDEFKNYVSDGIIFLDENYNICNITYEEIKNEVARYLANLENRNNSSINNGIISKITPDQLYEIYIEVNKGLENIDSPRLTEAELITEMKLPLYVAIKFLYNCQNLTDEEINKILMSNYKEEYQFIEGRTIEDLSRLIEELTE